MRKQWLMGLALSLVLLAGCSASNVVKTYESDQDSVMVTYQELKDGTWKCEDTVYQYRLELTGRERLAVEDSTFVVLSQREDVTFQEVSQGMISSILPIGPGDYRIVEMY